MIDKFAYSRVYNIDCIIDYKQTEHYSNIITWLVKLTNCKKYLELGVESSSTLSEIKKHVDLCVGVDVNDTWDKENITFYQMTTDEFFLRNTETFDIIFIDADHSFEQVRIDFDNAIKILNKYGIIILHDTDPIAEELLSPYFCSDSYKIVDYVSQLENINIITFPIQETGLTFVMRKNDRRINNFIKK
jgi:predicted O-methyltransferase YrrM